MLSTLLWLPAVGALAISLLPSAWSRRGAIAFASLLFLPTVWLLVHFDIHTAGYQMTEMFPWIPALGLNYSLGVDGVSLPLVVLSNFITWLVTIAPPQAGVQRPKLFYSLVFIICFGIAGALLAQNLLLFFLFYELEILPFYLMISIWGGEKRDYAAVKFLIYTAVSGILVLTAFLALNWLTSAGSFEYAAISTGSLSQITQLILLTLILVGFGIKMPLVPLHTWLPDAYVAASPTTAMLLGGVFSKLGTYGLLRFGLAMFPDTWVLVAPGLSLIAAFGVMYGALAAIAQHDIKRMVAYSSIGHMGYTMLGMAAMTPLSMVGAITQMVSHGLILALLFYLVGVIEAKVGTRELEGLNGLLNPLRGLPSTSALLILGGMASAGIPGMAGFIAEFLVFQGSYASFPIPTLLCVVGTGLTAVYFVILLNRTCFGRLDTATAYYPKVTLSERIPALILTILIIGFGVQPMWLLRWSEVTMNAISSLTTASTIALGS